MPLVGFPLASHCGEEDTGLGRFDLVGSLFDAFIWHLSCLGGGAPILRIVSWRKRKQTSEVLLSSFSAAPKLQNGDCLKGLHHSGAERAGGLPGSRGVCGWKLFGSFWLLNRPFGAKTVCG